MLRFINDFAKLLLILPFSLPLSAESLIEHRSESEKNTTNLPFVITPHKVNYLLPVTYNSSPNEAPFKENLNDQNLDNLEAKFQISIKVNLWNNIFTDNDGLYVAYTNTSLWQAYNQDISGPFRNTDHEPEVFWMVKNNKTLFDFNISHLGVGVNHQSNGQAGSLSRSWNRIYGMMLFDKGNFAFATKVWWRIPEDAKEPGSAIGDDNPDIEKYMGNFELSGLYAYEQHRFSAMLRNNLRKNNKGAIELTWSYPIVANLRLYAQYFNGYSESLIDYDHHNQRIGLGVSLNDLL